MQATETLKRMKENMMMQRYSRASIKTYSSWVAKFMAFVKISPASQSREDRVIAYLTKLAVKDHVSASTQKQALCAIIYLYKRVLKIDLGDLSKFTRSKRPERLPEVFSRQEAWAALDQLNGIGLLWGYLMYGCGLRLMGVYQLRVKDIDIDRRKIMIREGKGNKDRMIDMPSMLVAPLEKHLRTLRPVYERYAAQRVPVSLPDAIDRKKPGAAYEFGWFWLFPANGPVKQTDLWYVDPRWLGKLHHIHPTAIQKRICRAIRGAGITKRAGCHTFRHSFATHWLEGAEGSHEIALLQLQRILGHANIKTTMLYLHLVRQSTVPSPLDARPETIRRAA